MVKRFGQGIALSIVGMGLLTTPATAETHWVCAAEVPISKSAGVKMSWVGPAGRWVHEHTTYLTRFITDEPFETAPARSLIYGPAYEAFLRKAGYDLTSRVSGQDTDVACLYYRTDQEASATLADLSDGEPEARGVKLNVTPISVTWRPEIGKTSPTKDTPVDRAQQVSVLGARFEDVTAQTASFLGLEADTGAAVMSVEPGSAAAEGGLKRFDIVTEISGQVVAKASDVPSIVAKFKPGYASQFHVWRDKAYLDVAIVVSAQVHAETPAKDTPQADGKPDQKQLVEQAIRLAVDAETEARAIAEKAEIAAAEARDKARMAAVASQRAISKEAGFVVATFKNFGSENVTYSGEALKRDAIGLGVLTFSADKNTRTAGEVAMFTLTGHGSAPVLRGLAVVSQKDSVYAGQFLNGAYDGPGVYDFPKVAYVAGNWAGYDLNTLKGKGIARYPGLGECAGNFENGKLTGFGVYTLADGTRLAGYFQDGTLYGYGAELNSAGTVLRKGIWEGAKLVTPVD